jgi:pyruvate/2-oxoglutarate dehydrogenase complex dihydrolipoamide acyltransferase (E2) component
MVTKNYLRTSMLVVATITAAVLALAAAYAPGEAGADRIVWLALCLGGGSLVLNTATLLIAWRVLLSAYRSELAGEERLEILREQQERLEFMREERRLLLEELQRRRPESEESLREKPPLQAGGEGEQVAEEPAERSDWQSGEPPEATSAAKRKAKELGVDLWQVEGSGAYGRITVLDVLKAANPGMRSHRG